MKKFIWRVVFTIYGNRKCPHGLLVWWRWSEQAFFDRDLEPNPIESAQEIIFQISCDV